MFKNIKALIKNFIPSYRTERILEAKLNVMETKFTSLENNLNSFETKINIIIDQLVKISNENHESLHEIKCIGWQHLGRFLTYTAAMETSKFITENMPKTKSFEDKFKLLEYALSFANKDGLFLEFGVFQGETINFISGKVCEDVYGFDSFEGLPEDWRTGFDKSVFTTEGCLPAVNENVKLVKGWFDQSLPSFLDIHKESCSFIHVDCDLYSSTKCVFDLLKERIIPGTIIVFDEYFNYPGWQNGEHKAFLEFIQDTGYDFEYIGYTMIEQVAVKIGSKIEHL